MATNPNRTLNDVIARFDEVNAFYIKDLASQIAAIRDDETADYIAILAALTANMAAINARIDSAVKKSSGDLSQVYGSAVNEIYNAKRYKRELKANPLSKQAQQRIDEYRQRVERETARVMRRLGKANNVSQSYQQVANKAVLSRNSGLGNYEGIIRPTVRGIGRLGLQVTGDDGKHRNIVGAITRVIQDGIYEIERHTNDVVAKELRFDAVEISVHDNPAPDHEPIQGRVFLRSEYEKLQNHESCVDIDGERNPAQVRAIGELNCKHIAYGFSTLTSTRLYTRRELERRIRRNRRGCTIDGKHYTLYEARQLMQSLEAEKKRQQNIRLAAENAEDFDLQLFADRKISELASAQKEVQRALNNPNGHFENVTEEYARKSGDYGKIEFEDGYNRGSHKDEINVANYVVKHFGGNLRLLKEANSSNVKTPDYEWNGKLWELKTCSTEKAADYQIRKGVKQIQGNPGGIILDYRNAVVDIDILLSKVKYRVSRSCPFDADVIMLFSGDDYSVIRFRP